MVTSVNTSGVCKRLSFNHQKRVLEVGTIERVYCIVIGAWSDHILRVVDRGKWRNIYPRIDLMWGGIKRKISPPTPPPTECCNHQTAVSCALCKDCVIRLCMPEWTEDTPNEVSADGRRGILKSPPKISWPSENSRRVSRTQLMKTFWWSLRA